MTSPHSPRLNRRALLRLWAAGLAGTLVQRLPALTVPAVAADEQPRERPTTLTIESDATRLRARFDPQTGSYAVTSLVSAATSWIPRDAPPMGALWINGVQYEGAAPLYIDGSSDLEKLASTSASLRLLHRASNLEILLEYADHPGNAMTHRLSLTNRRSEPLYVGAAATLSLPLWAGDWTEALAADDAPNAWTMIRRDLPASFGKHQLRNASDGVYPLVRLVSDDGSGIVVAVSTATAWRVDVHPLGELRLLRAGEFQSDLTLAPGQHVQLPDVVTIFYQGGSPGAVESLRAYLESVSLPPPLGWDNTPPTVFNTWFGYGTAIMDDGSRDSELRAAARMAADSGVEVMVIDAGWYLGNPIPNELGERGQGSGLTRSSRVEPTAADASDDATPPVGAVVTADDFTPGLGTWVENPAKWLARSGSGGSWAAGLRNFSDYVHSLDVRRPNGTVAGKMRFGLWIEPERFDLGFRRPGRIPAEWAIPGTPILDLSNPEVVAGMTARLQHAIDRYGVDYLKVDANADLLFDVERGRSGHYWTRWSAGFEQLLRNLRQANPGLFLEHCASGLKRYWIGLPRLAHSTWLDDDVRGNNVGWLLDATDALMLPRQKTVLVTEDLASYPASIPDLVRTYWGADHLNGGTLGFSNRPERWGREQQRLAAEAIEAWKQAVRGRPEVVSPG